MSGHHSHHVSVIHSRASVIRNQVINDHSENDQSDNNDTMISLSDLSYSDPSDAEWSLPQKSHQYQTSNKNISSEDHYSPAQHSAPKRRKNEFGLPQSVNLTKLPTRPCDIAHSERNIKTRTGYYNSDTDTAAVTCLSPSLELDMENIKDVNNKVPGLIGDRERKFSDSSGSSPSTSMSSSSPKVIKSEYPPVFREKMGNKPMDHCHVCGDLAVAHMHYGGVCCYSCKAFFRRATQTGKDKKYKCKADRDCAITHNNRRSCQFCRFQKCLFIGMKPNWVLSDEQCNIRFRAIRQKKGTLKEVKQEVEEAPEVITQIKREQQTSPVATNLVMPFTSEEVRSVDYMIESYNLSKETFVFSEENDDLFRRLFQDSGGSGQGQSTSSGSGGKYSYNKLDLSSLIMTLMKKNVFFVTSIDKFKTLSPEDQVVLLRTNMTEMCHLRGAIRYDVKSKNFVWYFSKKDQLQMTFQKSDESQSPGKSSSRQSGSGSGFSFQNALIGQQDMSKFYRTSTTQKIFGMVSKLCEIGIPMEVFLILIHIVLFSSDNLDPFQSLMYKQNIENIQTEYMLFLHRYLTEMFGRDGGRMKLSQIMGCLVELRQLCERSKSEESGY